MSEPQQVDPQGEAYSSTALSQLRQASRSVRRHVLEMIVAAGRGHVGGSLSCADLLVALYHGGALRCRPSEPRWDGRDRLIFSKGHAVEALYAVLAAHGFFDPELLRTYGQAGTALGGHADQRVPGIEMSTGSLGHGLGVGAGMALGLRLGGTESLTYVLLGDGECYEGSVWEAAAFAAHHGLERLVAIVDRNRQITLDDTETCNRLEPFAAKWEAFGWEAVSVDGHRFEEILPVLGGARARRTGRPLVVLADTVKGKGISFMEGKIGWHHGVPTGDLIARARWELREPD